eukprot:scaffold52022_cov24-Phaeocystis_antarctica.AAC.1
MRKRMITDAEKVYSTQRNGAYLVRVRVGVRVRVSGLGSGLGVPAGEQAKVGLAPEQGVAQVEEEGEEEEACRGPLVRMRVT